VELPEHIGERLRDGYYRPCSGKHPFLEDSGHPELEWRELKEGVLRPWVAIIRHPGHARELVKSGRQEVVHHRRGAEYDIVVGRAKLLQAEYERKGHRFVDLDVEVTANGVAVWSAFHTAIWQPRVD